MNQTFPQNTSYTSASHTHSLANTKLHLWKQTGLRCAHTLAQARTQKTHTSLLRRMDVATKCTTFCSSQGLVRAPVNWEAILIFPLFMLWLWDYPFSHSFLKTTREILPSPFLCFFLFPSTSPSPPSNTHMHTRPHQHSSCTHPFSTAKSLLDPENCNSAIDHSCWILGLTKAVK